MNRRSSIALGSVKTVTLDDIKPDMTSSIKSTRSPDKKIRVLVTVHSVKPLLGDVYTRGLGLWVSCSFATDVVTTNVGFFHSNIIDDKASH